MDIKAVRVSKQNTIKDQWPDVPQVIPLSDLQGNHAGSAKMDPSLHLAYRIVTIDDGTLILVNAAYDPAKETHAISDTRWIGISSPAQLKAGWDGAQFQVTYQNTPIDIAILLDNKKRELSQARDLAFNVGSVSVLDYDFDRKASTQRDLKGMVADLVAGGVVPGGFSWTSIDNFEVTMSANDVKEFGHQMTNSIHADWANYKTKKYQAQVAHDANDVDALLAITW